VRNCNNGAQAVSIETLHELAECILCPANVLARYVLLLLRCEINKKQLWSHWGQGGGRQARLDKPNVLDAKPDTLRSLHIRPGEQQLDPTPNRKGPAATAHQTAGAQNPLLEQRQTHAPRLKHQGISVKLHTLSTLAAKHNPCVSFATKTS